MGSKIPSEYSEYAALLVGLSVCVRVVGQGGTSSSPGFVSRPDVILFYFIWKQKDEASITEVWRFVSYSQTKSLISYCVVSWYFAT